jgi:nitrous oxidase accessory protein NosD
LPGLGNIWDDGKEGNYWSDYLNRYPNALEGANRDVGNTAYTINENNIDRYPLLSPVVISDASLSPPQQQTNL